MCRPRRSATSERPARRHTTPRCSGRCSAASPGTPAATIRTASFSGCAQLRCWWLPHGWLATFCADRVGAAAWISEGRQPCGAPSLATPWPVGAVSDRSTRLDWVVLLPASARLPFDDALILGGADELGSALVAGDAAVSWRRPRSSIDTGSLVVVTEDCSLTLSEVARHLAPGGTLYMEVDRRRRGHRTRSPGRVERLLRKRGHELFSIHIAAPDFDHPRRYLPIDHAGALRWYLRVLVMAGTPLARAGSGVLSALLSTAVGGRLLRLSV